MPGKIILKGYYGFGNLGDDILMLTVYRWLQENYPAAEIVICTDSHQSSYIPTLLGRPVSIIQNHQDVEADCIIHGGGGIYFDFKEGGRRYRYLNRLIRMLGPLNYAKFYRWYRFLRGTIGIRSNLRIALGVGVGTYTESSRRFYADIPELVDFKFMMVRDHDSVQNLKALGIKCPIMVTSDLAFLDSYWKPKVLDQRKMNIIGFILRDWHYDNHQTITRMKDVADEIVAAGGTVQFFSFDRFSDSTYIAAIQSIYPIRVWNPYEDTVTSFLTELSKCSLVITSRAHGAIVSACLGIPSICLEIEPKLAHISSLLKHSSLLVKLPIEKHKLVETVIERMKELDALEDATKLDRKENQQLLSETLEMCHYFLKQQLKAI